MTDKNPDQASPQQAALSRWENEGGADTPQRDAVVDIPELTNTELVHLRVRVIALENVIISLLAQAPDQQHELVRKMANYITPRAGSTQHPLTIDAASHMKQFVDRAVHFRDLSDTQS
tara:strand:+ start:255 stop:608 length:354 start_codon:yes stop_codon:yes gene_type:complete